MGVEIAAGVYSITRIVGPVQFYLVQWLSAVGFVFLIVVGGAAIALWCDRREVRPLSRAWTVGGAALLVGLVCFGAVRALPLDARPGERGSVASEKPCAVRIDARGPDAHRHSVTYRTVVLRLDSESAWEILAAHALELEQHGKEVRILEAPVTRLLFDDALLVSTAPGSRVLAFRDLPETARVTGSALVHEIARQGRWHIVQVDPSPGSPRVPAAGTTG